MIRRVVGFSALALGQAEPTIINATNAAVPALDNPHNSIQVAPNSMATIFGTNLSDATIAVTPRSTTRLGRTDVHLPKIFFLMCPAAIYSGER
jgi:hypothetical protein